MLQIESLHKSFGDRIIFSDFDLFIDKGDKVGIIAPNGTGKTTLLKIIIGEESYESGRITTEKDIRIAYLPQLPSLPKDCTIREAILSQSNQTAQIVCQYEKAIAKNDELAIASLTTKMDHCNGWAYEQKFIKFLTALGIDNIDRVTNQLSGGEIKRIAIAMTLIDNPDLVLLDEPTNHLDLKSIEWLQDYLSTSNTTLLMITHDRYFLDNVCNSIVEIEDCHSYKYKGNYQYFIEKRTDRHQNEAQQLKSNLNLFRREAEWMSRQPQARGTKARYRKDAFEELKQKIINKERVEQIKLVQQKDLRIGKKIFEAYNLSLSFGDKKILTNFEYIFAPKEKIGIIGENGVGKTSFLRLITKEIEPSRGYIEIGETVSFGFYKQEMPSFDSTKRVIDIIEDIANDIKWASDMTESVTPTSLLSQFLFTPERQYTPVSKLSGGELRRLYLCTILIRKPNFLILDEPTNDLDILTLNSLEQYLIDYKGCVLIVSHDRYFMDKVVDHLFVFCGDGTITDFPGNYSLYRAYQEEQNKQQTTQTKKVIPSTQTYKSERKAKISYKEQKEIEEIQQLIPLLEEERTQLEEQMSTGLMPMDKLHTAAQRIETINNQIDEYTLRWLEIEDKYN